jgi:myo-inositol-1(or 4)-monophosphatase
MKDELEFAKQLALRAGEIMLKYFKKGMTSRLKDTVAVVTNADKEINRLVIDEVGKKYPDHSVLGEEESKDNNSDLVWFCDPIDGTWPYTKGVPIATFSLALVNKGVPLIGVVYDPFTKRLYSASKGMGAYLNNERIGVSKLSVKDSTIAVEWWPEAEYDIDPPMHRLSVDTKAYVLNLGGVVNSASLVASGKFEACIFAGTKGKGVDIAAVKVIVEEAGGRVTDLFGKEQLYTSDINGAIISNGVVHAIILEYLKDLKIVS